MGATTFGVTGTGKTAHEAFLKAVEESRYDERYSYRDADDDGENFDDYEEGGYSGTIAEKSSFVVISVPAGKDPLQYANKLLDDGDPRVDDKWGPAGCVKLREGVWYFFGWASE